MDFGSKVQMLRKNHGLSQEKLATILKINRHFLSRIETGKSEPTLSIIRDTANYFRVDVVSLMNIRVNNQSTSEKIRKISENCRFLMDDDLDFLLRIISIMREEYVKKD